LTIGLREYADIVTAAGNSAVNTVVGNQGWKRKASIAGKGDVVTKIVLQHDGAVQAGNRPPYCVTVPASATAASAAGERKREGNGSNERSEAQQVS